MNFLSVSRMLVIGVLWRQSMLQTNGCGRKSNAYIQPAYLTREFVQWCLNVLKQFGIMMDTQANDVVTFDFKGTHVRCFVRGYTDYQMDFSLVQIISKWSKIVRWHFEWNAFIHLELADINVKRT